MFIEEGSDTFTKTIYVKQNGFKVYVLSEEKYSKIRSKNKEGYERYQVKFRALTWGMQGDMQRECVFTNPETNMEDFNSQHYYRLKLSRGIVSWDFKKKNKDGEVEPVPVNLDTIQKLHPGVASFLLDLYDRETVLSEQEEKNL